MNEIEKYDNDGVITVAQAASEATAIETVRAAMTLAKRFPRDEIKAWDQDELRAFLSKYRKNRWYPELK